MHVHPLHRINLSARNVFVVLFLSSARKVAIESEREQTNIRSMLTLQQGCDRQESIHLMVMWREEITGRAPRLSSITIYNNLDAAIGNSTCASLLFFIADFPTRLKYTRWIRGPPVTLAAIGTVNACSCCWPNSCWLIWTTRLRSSVVQWRLTEGERTVGGGFLKCTFHESGSRVERPVLCLGQYWYTFGRDDDDNDHRKWSLGVYVKSWLFRDPWWCVIWREAATDVVGGASKWFRGLL